MRDGNVFIAPLGAWMLMSNDAHLPSSGTYACLPIALYKDTKATTSLIEREEMNDNDFLKHQIFGIKSAAS